MSYSERVILALLLYCGELALWCFLVKDAWNEAVMGDTERTLPEWMNNKPLEEQVRIFNNTNTHYTDLFALFHSPYTCPLLYGVLCVWGNAPNVPVLSLMCVFSIGWERKSHLFALFTETPAALSCSYSNKTKALFAGQQSRNTGLILVYLSSGLQYWSTYLHNYNIYIILVYC